MTDTLHVTSHVARDLLQSADLFRHPETVVWEYVANGLEYVDAGVQPWVRVTIAPAGTIRIVDNGRGMDRSALGRFFTMHAENQDRAAGRPGRGMFGTGKSAAFAIANTLRLTTVARGRRSIVRLTRARLEAAVTGDPVPVEVLVAEEPVDLPNGTCVEIEDLRVAKPRTGEIIRTIERHLRHWRGGIRVDVNGTPVEAQVPPIAETRRHTVSIEEAPLVTGCVLTIHVAKAPLAEGDRGIAILANGILHETTLGPAAGKPMSQYLFGDIDVPALDLPHAGIAAYDMSRSGRLNLENAVVLQVHAMIGRHIEAARQQLVEAERRRRSVEEAERLEREASAIARLINDDFAAWSRRLAAVRSGGSGTSDLRPATRADPAGVDTFVEGGEEPALTVGDGGPTRGAGSVGTGEAAPPPPPRVEPAEQDEADAAGHSEPRTSAKRHPSGGFSVEFRNNGAENARAIYQGDTRTIFVNLDHPQVVAARARVAIDDPSFLKLAYEIAFTEYAVGFAQEKVRQAFYTDLTEPLFDVRERIDALARRAADVFARS